MKPGGSTCARVGVQTKEEGFGETRRKHLCRSRSGHRNPWRMFGTSHVVSGHDKRKGPSCRRCNKAYITTLVCNRHLLIVELSHAIRDAGQQYLEFHFTFVRVYYLTTVEGKQFLPGSSLGNLDFGSRFKDFAWFRVCALWLTTSVVLLPCAVSFRRTRLLTLVHN